jgi:hypothetical protein
VLQALLQLHLYTWGPQGDVLSLVLSLTKGDVLSLVLSLTKGLAKGDVLGLVLSEGLRTPSESPTKSVVAGLVRGLSGGAGLWLAWLWLRLRVARSRWPPSHLWGQDLT